MNFKIKKDDFPILEMFLFKLNYPCDCTIQVSFIDSDEIYEYKTIELGHNRVLITQ